MQFPDIERRLKTYVRALWAASPVISSIPPEGAESPRRSSFNGTRIRLPYEFRGYAPARAQDLYHAALAHIEAHLLYGKGRFKVGSLKPVQIALISLIEDARVERLLMRDLPGVRRLFHPFHVAFPGGGTNAPALMARLSRALFDRGYQDSHGFVEKGRALFEGARARWEDPALSREVGGLLGNDLGQMRAQFNAKTYVAEPPYRDDNSGLWDFPHDASAPPTEALPEGVRFDEIEDEATPPDREREEMSHEEAGRASLLSSEEEVGIPIARYPEWDYRIGADRPEWTTLVEFPGRLGEESAIGAILDRNAPLVQRITKLVRSAKVSRPIRLRRQNEGDRLDLDAAIEAAIDHRLTLTPDPKVYAKLERKARDLQVLVLIDASQSTHDRVPGAGRSVLELEREAVALLAHAMAELGDPFALHSFCSNGREEVRYTRLKDFEGPYDEAARARLAGLDGQYSTRFGTALRHAGATLAARRAHRRLLLVVTDGEPADIDIADRRYLVEDARHAVMTLTHHGIDVFCVGLDAGGDHYLSHIFGRRNVVQIDRLERLPAILPLLYFRLTA
ncbi:MAG TPA: VWA domain-containing protein [Stellaceae bacterium]|nr:VWA domain-containing protein [Stellaceae bacterium]